MRALDATLLAAPLAFAAHVADEAPGFPRWARCHASPRYSDRDFAQINAAGFALTLAGTALALRGGRRGFLVHYVSLSSQAVFNALFHAFTGAPGRRTAIGLVLPLWLLTTALARAAGLLDRRTIAAALALGGPLHAAAVAQQVYGLRVSPR
jgi:hypothetical protein